jgi:hypothetical protein
LVTTYGLDYSTSFTISAMISLLGVGIVLLTVKNETKADRVQKSDNSFQDKEQNERIMSFWDIINPRNNFLQVIAFPFNKRGASIRMMILMLLVVFIFSAAPIHGKFLIRILIFGSIKC